MRSPLPPNLARASLSPGGNTGLWYDKFCNRWNEEWRLSSKSDENPKLQWIRTVTGEPVGRAALVAEASARIADLTLARRGALGVFVAASRFVTGLGRRHPVENGFAWHPTLGVPYLPGSSVKGLVRAWAELDADPVAPKERVEAIFGSQNSSGDVVFLDALPVAPVRLEADVMTPHYAGWSPPEPENLPGDWRSPTPVPFLAVAAGGAFAFSILPADTGGTPGLAEVFGWLKAALEVAGAGAKTSVGYGRFTLDEAKTAALRTASEQRGEAERRADLERSPEGRWRLRLKGKKELEVLEAVRVHLEKARLEDPAERRGLSQAVAAGGFLDSWRKGKPLDRATNFGAAKLKERAKLVDAELTEEKA